MAINIPDADAYITDYCIVTEDWFAAGNTLKQSIINRAARILGRKFPSLTIPDAAVYEYANELSIAFNDSNRLQQQGVASFTLTGVAAMTFKDWAKNGEDAWISDAVLDLISEANGNASVARRVVKWTIM